MKTVILGLVIEEFGMMRKDQKKISQETEIAT